MNEEEISAGLQMLGKRLAELLDEDQFAECADSYSRMFEECSEERDTLRQQLAEARDLLAVASEIIHEQAIHIDRQMTDFGVRSLDLIDAWLEANK